MVALPTPLDHFLKNKSAAALLRACMFLVVFWLILTSIRTMPAPFLGRASAPVGAVIITLLTLFSMALFLRSDKGSWKDVALSRMRGNLPNFVFGVCLGVALAAAMIGALVLFSNVDVAAVDSSNLIVVVGTSFIIFFALALMEEVAFRTYALFRLRQALGVRPAIYLSSIAFAMYHGFAFDNLLGPGVWGLVYGWMAIKTNSIALPTGFHMGANWLQGLLGMKPQYTASVWELSIAENTGMVDIQTLGIGMQIILLIVGVALIEHLTFTQRRSVTSGPTSQTSDARHSGN